MTSWVTFLSDYGLDDVFVGVCKGVLARAPASGAHTGGLASAVQVGTPSS